MLEEFLKGIPDDDRLFFRHDLSDPERVRRWCAELDYQHMLPLLAWHGSHIAADGTLLREPGAWTAHVGKLRLLVHPDFRRQGIGIIMVQEVIEVASQLGLHKLVRFRV
jgi:GNAT superfamily N-acetyltransferase